MTFINADFRTATPTVPGYSVVALERSEMVAGRPYRLMHARIDMGNASGLLPSDLDGSNPPPAGSPNVLMDLDPPNNSIRTYSFYADWSNPSASQIIGPISVSVAPLISTAALTRF